MLSAIELQQHVGRVVEKGVLDLPCIVSVTTYVSEVGDFLGIVANVLFRLLLACVVFSSLRGGNAFLCFLPTHRIQMVLPYERLSEAIVQGGQRV